MWMEIENKHRKYESRCSEETFPSLHAMSVSQLESLNHSDWKDLSDHQVQP